MKRVSLFVTLLLISLFIHAQGGIVKIDELLQKENYAKELWEPRGLIPSPDNVIKKLEFVTKAFLKSLRVINQDSTLDKSAKLKMVKQLVDELPWIDFDTEEKEFLADVLAPAIESMGFNPWTIF